MNQDATSYVVLLIITDGGVTGDYNTYSPNRLKCLSTKIFSINSIKMISLLLANVFVEINI